MTKDSVYGGKTVDEWIEVVENGKADKRQDAIQTLQGMITDGFARDKESVFKIAKAVGKATHHAAERTRIVAYGVIGIAARHFAFNLGKGTEREKLHASWALRLMIKGSRNLHADLVKIAPDVVRYMLNAPKLNEDHIQAIVERLEQEKGGTKGKQRETVTEALAKIEAIRARGRYCQ